MACTIKAGSRVGCSTGSRQRGESEGGQRWWVEEGGWGGVAQKRAGTDGEEVLERTKSSEAE